MKKKSPWLRGCRARVAFAIALALPAFIAQAQRGAGEGLSSQRDTWVTANAFDPQALTVTLESIDLREKQIAEREDRRSGETRAMAEQCASVRHTAPPALAAIPTPALPSGPDVRPDLQGKSLDELTRLYAETRDPAIQAAVARIVTAQAMRGLPSAIPVAPVAVPSAGNGPMGRAMDEAMRRQLNGMDPSIGRCLEAAETKDREEVGLDYFLRGVDTRAALDLLRKGRATAVLVDVAGFFSKLDKNGEVEATSPVGRYLRFNLVRQSHSAARQATPLDEATEERAKNPRGGMWPDPVGR